MLTAFDIDVAGIVREVAASGLAIVRPTDELRALATDARADYLAAFGVTPPQPPKRPFKPANLSAGPWRKYTIGSRNGIGEAYAQLLQTMYFDPAVPTYPSLNRLFAVVIALRNTLMNVASDFGSDPARDGFWNACRVHHYPRGGGFMMTHCDTYFPVKLGDLPFYQVMAPLSLKGRDFSAGGGIVVTRQGERLNTDDLAGLGSIVVFDGRTPHGVEDVDPQAILDFNDAGGRLAAFANLYVTQA
jgi:hypothetical protein